MKDTLTPDLCVIGAGSGGLAVAAGAVQMGASVVLVERGRMGGDCLNYGCVPSKSLLAAARLADSWRHGAEFGVLYQPPQIDFAAVADSVGWVVARIAPNDSAERFERLGVRVIPAEARFVDRRNVRAGAAVIRPRRFVIATGSSPVVPPIPGIDTVPYLTNETVFANRVLPGHLVVIGGGPIGIELAQAHRRLGAAVTVIDAGPLLPREDAELAGRLTVLLAAEGIALKPSVSIVGIEASVRGITVDARLRTTNRHAFAIGDAAGGPQFTHVALYHAGIVIRNALFRLPARVDYRALPWVTYTDPELAQAGSTEAAARAEAPVEVLRWSFADNDRAQTERDTAGEIKIVTSRNGRILGATILGATAGDLILPWALAISQKLKIGALANLVVPYPTRGEAGKRAAGNFYTPTLFAPRTRRLVRMLARFG